MSPTNNNVLIMKPTRKEVESLMVGDPAIDAFGKMRRVVKISYRGVDLNGKAYVGYYTEFGEGSSMSNSMKEGEIVRTVALSNVYNSAEIDRMERA